MKKNILIVDDHPIVSTGLQALIEHTGEYGKIYVTNNITSSRLLLRQKDIDIAIIDLELQDANGMELIKYIHQTHINTKILVYTMHEELWTIRQLMKEDADAIVMKGDNPQEVLIALRKIEQGKGYFSQQFMRLINSQDTSEITLSTTSISSSSCEVIFISSAASMARVPSFHKMEAKPSGLRMA